MLNKDNVRELAYLARVTDIKPMDADKLECVCIQGWNCVCSKGDFKIGDIGVFFETDAKLPDVPPFNEIEFLRNKDFKIKVQKLRGVYSQGLLLPLSAFGWVKDEADDTVIIPPEKNGKTEVLNIDDESKFLTNRLNVTYAVLEDNQRKSNGNDKYRGMQDRHKKIFRSKFGKWIMKYSWGRKIMFFFFGKKKDKSGWPSWVVKTDEERVQNLPFLFPKCDTEWIATEKIDGTSTTFTMKNDRKKNLIVCSRNVVFDKPDKKCYYESNVYLEMAEKYKMQTVLEDMIRLYDSTLDTSIGREKSWGKLEYITIQGETYGGNIQKRDYGPGHRLAVFNIIFGYENNKFRLNPILGKRVAEAFGLEYVPIVNENVILPATCDETLQMAHGKSVIDGKLREGLVFRSYDGAQSFKAVDPEFLLKYHQ